MGTQKRYFRAGKTSSDSHSFTEWEKNRGLGSKVQVQHLIKYFKGLHKVVKNWHGNAVWSWKGDEPVFCILEVNNTHSIGIGRKGTGSFCKLLGRLSSALDSPLTETGRHQTLAIKIRWDNSNELALTVKGIIRNRLQIIVVIYIS